MKYVMIFHANLNYAYLDPDKYEFVIRNSYELLFDTMAENFPNTKFVFEASGYTIEQIAKLTPDVLEKLKAAIARGACEFMGSPYAHPMLPNFPEEDGTWSIKFAMDIFEKHLGFKPKSLWNPECGWRSYVPQQAIANGVKNLIGDFEAYSRSKDASGKPCRPEIYEKEFSDDPSFYSFDFKYDLEGSERAIHHPFQHIQGIEDGKLRMFLRTDRIAQFGVRYFMGMEGYTFEKYMGLIKKYSEQKPGEKEGAVIIFADDAEYIGTNGWFRLKYQNKPDNVFEVTPESREKLIRLVSEVEKNYGEFITYDEACNDIEPLDDVLAVDDDAAWHGARASTWAGTPMASILRPWQDLVREKLHAVKDTLDPATVEKVWFHLTNSYNSDGQWPPTLPHAPHIIYPFNYQYCFDNLLMAEMLLGGVDRSRLSTSSTETMLKILTIQQDLVLDKAKTLIANGTDEEKANAKAAVNLIEASRNLDSVKAASDVILYPSEYGIRANALIAARRLVGGVVLEQV